MRRIRLASIRKPDHDALVSQVARGLSEGAITLADINELTDRQVRALLAGRTSAQQGPTAAASRTNP